MTHQPPPRYRTTGEIAPQSRKIQMVTAVIGAPGNPLDATDVTEVHGVVPRSLCTLLTQTPAHYHLPHPQIIADRVAKTDGLVLEITPDEDLSLSLPDPTPDNPKVLFLRYAGHQPRLTHGLTLPHPPSFPSLGTSSSTTVPSSRCPWSLVPMAPFGLHAMSRWL